MASKTAARASQAQIEAALAASLAESLLPGDSRFTPRALREAAAFMAVAAARREPGEALVCIESVSGAPPSASCGSR